MSDTRFDRLVNRIKDHPILAWVLLLSFVITSANPILNLLSEKETPTSRPRDNILPDASCKYVLVPSLFKLTSDLFLSPNEKNRADGVGMRVLDANFRINKTNPEYEMREHSWNTLKSKFFEAGSIAILKSFDEGPHEVFINAGYQLQDASGEVMADIKDGRGYFDATFLLDSRLYYGLDIPNNVAVDEKARTIASAWDGSTRHLRVSSRTENEVKQFIAANGLTLPECGELVSGVTVVQALKRVP